MEALAVELAIGGFPRGWELELVVGVRLVRRRHRELDGDRFVDCGFSASGACFDNFAAPWAYTFGPEKNAIAFFAFRLLWKLQTIGTVPAVDWTAYGDVLSRPDSEEG